jgi:hypothetical protein
MKLQWVLLSWMVVAVSALSQPLAFDDQESEFAKNAREVDEDKGPHLTWSIGAVVGKEGKVADLRWAGPAVELLVKEGDRYRSVKVDDHGGLRYPKLVRVESVPDRLTAILAPR